MNNIIKIFIEFVIAYLFLFILYYFMFIRKKTKYNKNKIPVEYYYLVNLYKLDEKKINYKKFVYISSFINCFIVSFTYIIISNFIDKFWLQIIIGMVLIFLFIIILYGILGRYYQKRGKKNV